MSKCPIRPALPAAWLALPLALACASPLPPMSQERMESWIANQVEDFRGRPGLVEFRLDGVALACISDPGHDRMRIVAPIARADDVDPRLLFALLMANYHSTLDARYAISEGVIYAAYLHPLSELTEAQLHSALRQVVSLVHTYGSSFSSGELVFGVEEEDPF